MKRVGPTNISHRNRSKEAPNARERDLGQIIDTIPDITERNCAGEILDGERRLLEMVASGCRLGEVLEATCGIVDALVSNSACSILLIDLDGKFRHGAGPALPPGYESTINGVRVAPEAGPCGTAASSKDPVIVPDLVSDSRWDGVAWRALVLEHGLRSVCSTPIVSLHGKVLGTFAVYRRDPGTPSALLRDLIARFTHIASIAIERVKKESDLRERERESRTVLDTIPGLVSTFSPSGEIEILNQRMLEYFGKPLEEITHWEKNDIIHPEDLTRVIRLLAQALASEEPLEYEARLRRFDGVYRWFQVRAFPARDSIGRVARWYALITDIDDLKRAQEGLADNERNLRLIINTIPTHIYVLNAEGFVQQVNQAVMDYTGLTLEDVQQEDYRDRVIHPEDFKMVREGRAASLRQAAPFTTEQRVLRNDGQYRWFLVSYKPLLDEQGSIVRWYVAAFDIEDRKRAEAQVEQAYLRLAEAQRLSKTGSFITDLLVDDHDWSEETFRIFEFDPAAKVTVKMIRDTVHPEDLPSFDAVIARGMAGTDVDFGFRIVTSRGAVKHLRGMARVMAESGGRPLFIGALQDVTESKVAEEAVDRARSELARVGRITTLNALTASIAHEVNQPLSGIITNANTCRRMLDGVPPNVDGALETARRIIRDGNRASDVITRLRAMFSKKDFTLEPLNLNEATREVIELSLGDLKRNEVILRLELADDLPPLVGDRVQLQQVILNLLRNASDAMRPVQDRPRELIIRTQREEGDRMRLTVRDAGVGFTPDAGDKLFEAFYTTKTDGMGIGLSVSRSIIERHYGRLWAEPNDGPGATFSFSIPCSPESVTSRGPQ